MEVPEVRTPIAQLVLEIGRAFYTDESYIILRVLIREKWVKDKEWADKLNLQTKQVNRYLKELTQQHMIQSWCSSCKQQEANCRCRRPETWTERKANMDKEREAKRIADTKNANTTSTSTSIPTNKTGNSTTEDPKPADKLEKDNGSLFWYVDYKHFVNVVKYRLVRMREKLLREEVRLRLANSDMFECPQYGCARRYTNLAAQSCINIANSKFECSNCGTELKEVDVSELVRSKETLVDKMRRQMESGNEFHNNITKLIEMVDSSGPLDTNHPNDSIEFANRYGYSVRQLEEMEGDGSNNSGKGRSWGAQYHHYTDRIEVELVNVEDVLQLESARVLKKQAEDAKARRKLDEEAQVKKKSLPWFIRGSSVTGDLSKNHQNEIDNDEKHEKTTKKDLEKNNSEMSIGTNEGVANKGLKMRMTYAQKYQLQYKQNLLN